MISDVKKHVYCLAPRNAAVVHTFLDNYLDKREFSKQIQHKVQVKSQSITEKPWQQIMFSDLTSIIRAGMEQNKVFNLYAPAKKHVLTGISLAFCEDNYLVLGVSLPYESTVDNLRVWLERLIKQFNCQMGLIATEQYPPLNKNEFLAWSKEIDN